MQYVLLYITTPDKQTANKIANALLQERLIACANVMDGLESHYWWEGKITSSQETLLIVKTQKALAQQATEQVQALHPYECPAIISLPIENGYPPFLEWIRAETSR